MGITPYAAAQFTTFYLPSYGEQAISGANTFAPNYTGRGRHHRAQRARPAHRSATLRRTMGERTPSRLRSDQTSGLEADRVNALVMKVSLSVRAREA